MEQLWSPIPISILGVPAPFHCLGWGLHIPVSLLLPRRCNSTVPSGQPSNYYPEGIWTALLSLRTSGRGHIALLFLYFLGTYSWGHPALTISSPRGQTDPGGDRPFKSPLRAPAAHPAGPASAWWVLGVGARARPRQERVHEAHVRSGLSWRRRRRGWFLSSEMGSSLLHLQLPPRRLLDRSFPSGPWFSSPVLSPSSSLSLKRNQILLQEPSLPLCACSSSIKWR